MNRLHWTLTCDVTQVVNTTTLAVLCAHRSVDRPGARHAWLLRCLLWITVRYSNYHNLLPSAMKGVLSTGDITITGTEGDGNNGTHTRVRGMVARKQENPLLYSQPVESSISITATDDDSYSTRPFTPSSASTTTLLEVSQRQNLSCTVSEI